MPQAAKTQQQHDKPQTSDHRKTMLVMWTAMAHAFGSSWVSQYGTSEEAAFRSWSKALEQYSPEQIRRGVKNAADPDMWADHFPPNLSEFAKLCLSVNREHLAPYHQPMKIGHKPKPASEDVKNRELDRQRTLLETGNLTGETFAQSYESLALHRRWGPLDKDDTRLNT